MLGEILKKLRSERNLLQKDVAKVLNITPSAYGFYEQGERVPNAETLQKLAEYFDVTVDYLLGRTNIRKPYISESYLKNNSVTNKDLKQYEDFIKHAGAFFMDDEVNEEDKEKLFKDISELFWKSKEINKQKYGRKKKSK
mgnify:CR=1 FL=1